MNGDVALAVVSLVVCAAGILTLGGLGVHGAVKSRRATLVIDDEEGDDL